MISAVRAQGTAAAGIEDILRAELGNSVAANLQNLGSKIEFEAGRGELQARVPYTEQVNMRRLGQAALERVTNDTAKVVLVVLDVMGFTAEYKGREFVLDWSQAAFRGNGIELGRLPERLADASPTEIEAVLDGLELVRLDLKRKNNPDADLLDVRKFMAANTGMAQHLKLAPNSKWLPPR